MRVPSSTPGGMFTDNVFSRRARPCPAHALHGFSMTRPAPWHVAQGRSIVKKPCCARIRPRPWQVGHVTGFDPASAPPAAAHELAEHLVEDVGKPAGKAEITGPAPASLLEGGMAKAVISGS